MYQKGSCLSSARVSNAKTGSQDHGSYVQGSVTGGHKWLDEPHAAVATFHEHASICQRRSQGASAARAHTAAHKYRQDFLSRVSYYAFEEAREHGQSTQTLTLCHRLFDMRLCLHQRPLFSGCSQRAGSQLMHEACYKQVKTTSFGFS